MEKPKAVWNFGMHERTRALARGFLFATLKEKENRHCASEALVKEQGNPVAITYKSKGNMIYHITFFICAEYLQKTKCFFKAIYEFLIVNNGFVLE